MAPEDRASIERFVRDTLGCRCPDEVFQSLRIGRLSVSGATTPVTRLVVGDRLLVYVTDAGDGEPGKAPIEALAAAGCADRDREGLNRVRLVLASDWPDSAAHLAHERFVRAAECDERAHLHLVGRGEVPASLHPWQFPL